MRRAIDRGHARLGGAVRVRARVYAVLIAAGKVGALAAASRRSWAGRRSALLLFVSLPLRAAPARRSSARPSHAPTSPRAETFSVPVGVGPVAAQRGRRVRSSRRRSACDGRAAHVHPVGGEHVERALGDRELPERRRVDVVGHHEVAGAEVAQVEHERAVARAPRRDDRVRRPRRARRAGARGRPGASRSSTRSQRSLRTRARARGRARRRRASQSSARTSLTPMYRQPRS